MSFHPNHSFENHLNLYKQVLNISVIIMYNINPLDRHTTKFVYHKTITSIACLHETKQKKQSKINNKQATIHRKDAEIWICHSVNFTDCVFVNSENGFKYSITVAEQATPPPPRFDRLFLKSRFVLEWFKMSLGYKDRAMCAARTQSFDPLPLPKWISCIRPCNYVPRRKTRQ